MRKLFLVAAVSLGVPAVSAVAQPLPTSQPKYLKLIIEEVKVGHEDEHATFEAGWTAALEKAKSPYTYLGLASLTGAPQAWFIQPFESNQAIGDDLKRGMDDRVLAADLARLSRGDAAHVNAGRIVLLMARPELSHGPFPDVGKQRFYEMTLFRVRPGHEDQFAEAGKAYGAAAGRLAPNAAYRVYEVVSGMPGPAYLIVSSVVAHGDFDKDMADGEAVMKGMSKEEQAAIQKFGAEALVSSETQRFRVDPSMSYVSKEVRALDPAFWNPKKPAPKPGTTASQPQGR